MTRWSLDSGDFPAPCYTTTTGTTGLLRRSCNPDLSLFERCPQALEGLSLVKGHLVQEQDAMMSQSSLMSLVPRLGKPLFQRPLRTTPQLFMKNSK